MENTFNIPMISENEEERLQTLYRYDILGEASFKYIASMAAHVFKVPIALVSFVDREFVVFNGNVGLEGTDQMSRGISLCSLAILKKGVTVFEDTRDEPCLVDNPLVAGHTGLRFYAAATLTTPEGLNIGTVCIIDKERRTFSKGDEEILENIASIVMEDLEGKLATG